jgi:Arc/MetJ-type ribon-helix-helix transcriptional regulator
MGPIEGKSYQLRVRITAEERDHLEKIRVERGRGETISDLVREAIRELGGSGAGRPGTLSPKTQGLVDRLAVLLKREPAQVEEACVEGILDLIEAKCEVPLLVMETRLHLKYRNRNDPAEFPWNVVDGPKGVSVETLAPADGDGKAGT